VKDLGHLHIILQVGGIDSRGLRRERLGSFAGHSDRFCTKLRVSCRKGSEQGLQSVRVEIRPSLLRFGFCGFNLPGLQGKRRC